MCGVSESTSLFLFANCKTECQIVLAWPLAVMSRTCETGRENLSAGLGRHGLELQSLPTCLLIEEWSWHLFSLTPSSTIPVSPLDYPIRHRKIPEFLHNTECIGRTTPRGIVCVQPQAFTSKQSPALRKQGLKEKKLCWGNSRVATLLVQRLFCIT